MKHLLALFSACSILASCSSESSEKPTPSNEITFNKNEVTKTPDGIMLKKVLTSANQFSSCREVWINSYKFDLAVEGKDTTYLATSDHLFRTPEKLHVGTTFAEIPGKLRKTLSKEPGWGYYVTLPSGWNLGFCEGAGCTDSEPTVSSKVKWIFKRK
ncbi:hypothetical protein [Fluviicola sp.]|uniref:hypothetical protein n=1 Tax=Fluviicola sp. TaxID=1917219 RepID=UPI0031DFBC0E